MYYMKVANRNNDFTNGFEIRAYETAQDRQKALDHLWNTGGNGMFCTRKEVEGHYGKDFNIYKENEVGEKYLHLDPYCIGVVGVQFYKSERSYS